MGRSLATGFYVAHCTILAIDKVSLCPLRESFEVAT